MNYSCLDDDISRFSKEKSTVVSSSSSFEVDKNKSSIFYVERGEAVFATSWRENENNREVLAAVRAEEGEFVLYLPGEPFAVKDYDGAVVEIWRAN